MIPNTKGAFGRQARYRHGPLPVIATAHPASMEYMQLASDAHKHNLLQYAFAPGVQAVLADRQLPPWVSAYLPRHAAHRAQVVELGGGARLIAHLHRAKHADDDERVNVQQLHRHLWLIERTSQHVERTPLLNRNLELVGQTLKSHHDQDLSSYTAAIVQALRSGQRATVRQLTAYLQLRSGRRGVEEEAMTRAAVCSLLLAHRLSINLAEAEFGDASRLVWGGIGTGQLPPMPTGAAGFVLSGEAA